MFTRTIRLFSVGGIPVGIHASWLVVFALATWSFATGFYPEAWPGLLSPGGRWAAAALTTLLLFVSIILHELGHALVARRDGLPIRGITLFMFGGVAGMGREADDPAVELRMAAAGPVTSLALAALLGASAVPLRGTPAGAVLETVAYLNIGVLLFNLVPGFPLDGGRILRAAIWRRSGNLRRATRIAAAAGTAFAWLLAGAGAVNAALLGNIASGIWMVLIGVFLGRASAQGYRQVLWRETLGALRVGDLMRRDIAPAPAFGGADALREDAPALLLYPFLAEQGRDLVPVVDVAGRLVGSVVARDVSDRIRMMTSLEG